MNLVADVLTDATMEEPQTRGSEGSGLALLAGFFLASRIVIVLLSVRLLGADARSGAEAGLVLGLMLLGLVCFCCLGGGGRSFRSILRLPSMRWVFVFLAFSGLSLTWSVTVSLPASIVYWCGLASDVATVIVLLSVGSMAETSGYVMKGFVWGACCLALIAWIMPVQADLRLGDEEFFNTNQIGNVCAFGIFLSQYLMRRRDGRWWLAGLFLGATLVRSLSKTTLIAFALSQGFLLVQDRSMSRRKKLLITAAVMFVILTFWALFEAYYDIYTTADNQAQTLTGRTAIWFVTLNEAVQKPWIGHGFDSMWKVIPPFGPDRFEPRHAENELLHQFYIYGVAGIVMLVGLYGSLYRSMRRLPRGPLPILLTSLILFVAVRGLAEAEPFDLLLPLWMIVLLALAIEDADGSRNEGIADDRMRTAPIVTPL